MTWASRIHSPSIFAVLYSMGPSIHMPGECRGREQSRIGIIIRLIKNGRISFPFISPTCLLQYGYEGRMDKGLRGAGKEEDL